MLIPELLRERRSKGEPSLSFEFFPPKTEEATVELFTALGELKRLEPDFASVTYGAAGSTREGTVEVSTRILREIEIETMAHLSCVGETIDGLEAILERLRAAEIENVLALRGDPPSGAADFQPPEGGLRGSAELAAFIHDRGSWGVGASCFPEIHPEAASPEADIAYLQEKVDSGAEFLISQLFFDNVVFFDWLAQVRAAGIEVPVLVGMLPIRSYAGLVRFCKVCDARIPGPLHEALRACGGDPTAERALGVAYAARQGEELLAGGVDGLHFYTLNRSDSTLAVVGALAAARPWTRAARGAGARATPAG